jgi:hypothetical protein
MAGEGSPHERSMGRNAAVVEISSRVAAIASLLLSFGATACASVVIVEEAPSGSSGGAGGNGPEAPGLEPQGCSGDCVGTSDGKSCSCTRSCDGQFNKISCAPMVNELGEQKLQCVCTVEDYFSGVCFESQPENMCDIAEGCCAKYFQGK